MAASSLQAPKTKTLVKIRAWKYSGKWINPIETHLLVLLLFREWKRSLRTQTFIIHVQDRSGQLYEQQQCALATTCNRKFSNFVACNNMLQSKEVRTSLLATTCNRRAFENYFAARNNMQSKEVRELFNRLYLQARCRCAVRKDL
jgi:hypothetical protein